MGIPSYFSHIIKQYRQILKQINNPQYHHLYFDSNSIIYDALHIVDFLNMLYLNEITNIYIFLNIAPIGF